MVTDLVPLELEEDSLHVWTASVTEGTPRPSSKPEALSADEWARVRRLQRPEDQQLFAHAHVVVRKTLSRYSSIAPDQWTFTVGEHGRPEIGNENAPPGLRFNLSHTPGMVAVVVNRSFDAGVDVEGVGRVDDLGAMAKLSFSDPEEAALISLPTPAQPLHFTKVWALKESFIKAMGTGLTTPLRSFSFDLSNSPSIRFGCDPTIDKHPLAWSFTIDTPTNSHVLATASRLGLAKSPKVKHFTYV